MKNLLEYSRMFYFPKYGIFKFDKIVQRTCVEVATPVLLWTIHTICKSSGMFAEQPKLSMRTF
jgi:hypothetical protein